jgi:metal-dependent amidase/aminoacylase/carboxypeptidase family protein
MEAKDAARARLDGALPELLALSRRIHAHPELAFEEERAAAWVAETLDAGGFAVERGIAGLPTALPNTTAFRASATPAATT